jgi:hypothetical protein
VLTTPFLVQFRDWLVSRSEALVSRSIVNATGAGILEGGRITQADLASLTLPEPGRSPADRVAAAWRESSIRNLGAGPRLEEALAARDNRQIPMDKWLEFGGDTASAEQIVASLAPAWRTAPVVTAQPAAVFWEAGSSATFTAAATGGPLPGVQWQQSADGGSQWTDIAGATASTYVMTMTASDSGRQFRAVFTNRSGSVTTSAAPITAAIGGVIYDFNADGKPDILWRHPTSGANIVWYMRGVERSGVAALDAVPDPAWRLAGAGDFTGNGKPDLLWRYSVTGDIAVWHMDGKLRTSQSIPGTEPDPGWTIVGTGDFNGDGRSDILWRHSVSGANRIWLMEGTSLCAVGRLDPDPDPSWTIVGTADFNGDGKPGILWRNVATGANRVWYMDGVRRLGIAALDAEPDLAWTIVGAGDFNGDGAPDILWRNSVSGAMVVWYMDGVRRTGVAPVAPVNAAVEERVKKS